MPNIIYDSNAVVEYLDKVKIATLPQIKTVLNNPTSMTLFRILKQFSYHSSCTHNGKFYTLSRIADFDVDGLWRYQSVLFSVHGTLIATVIMLIEKSKSGHSSKELNATLLTETRETLLKLSKRGEVIREKIDGVFIYFSRDNQKRRKQRLMRNEVGISAEGTNVLAHELKAAIVLFYSMLDEQQRRLYAGLESIRLGTGGDRVISRLLNIDSNTVARGRKALLDEDVVTKRTRKTGAGRPDSKKKP